MKVELGSLVSSASGRLGGSVFAMQSGHCTVRNRGVKTMRPSARNYIWSRLTHLIVVAWRTMSVSNRLKWQVYAITYFNDFRGAGTGSMSAYSVFRLLSGYRQYYTTSIITSPGIYLRYTMPKVRVYYYRIGDESLRVDLINPVTIDYLLVVHATRPLPKGISSPPNNYRFIRVMYSTSTYIMDLISPYKAVWGSLGTVGCSIFLKVVAVSKATGIPSNPVFIRLVSLT